MKVTLEFNIHTENDESYELKRALHGLEYYLALCDIQQFIRKTIKHGVEKNMTQEELLEIIESHLPGDMS